MNGLTRFDDLPDQQQSVATAAPIETISPRIDNGYYTLTFPDFSHRTFRVYRKNDKSKFAPGKRIIGMLIGPDNTSDYEDFAFLTEQGFQVWKRFKSQKHSEYADIILRIASGEVLDGYMLEVSKRCLVCNRELTDPTSLERGIGPHCWEKIHGDDEKLDDRLKFDLEGETPW